MLDGSKAVNELKNNDKETSKLFLEKIAKKNSTICDSGKPSTTNLWDKSKEHSQKFFLVKFWKIGVQGQGDWINVEDKISSIQAKACRESEKSLVGFD